MMQRRAGMARASPTACLQSGARECRPSSPSIVSSTTTPRPAACASCSGQCQRSRCISLQRNLVTPHAMLLSACSRTTRTCTLEVLSERTVRVKSRCLRCAHTEHDGMIACERLLRYTRDAFAGDKDQASARCPYLAPGRWGWLRMCESLYLTWSNHPVCNYTTMTM